MMLAMVEVCCFVKVLKARVQSLSRGLLPEMGKFGAQEMAVAFTAMMRRIHITASNLRHSFSRMNYQLMHATGRLAHYLASSAEMAASDKAAIRQKSSHHQELCPD
jgi:hypothetical protein